MPNRLAGELSPYLLQHAENPVSWYPWGDEAFAKAREEGKPIFLSIGYSTCHWCHVMAHESFESSEVADILNRNYVAIKVDREERPDIDRVYMAFVQASTGAGGWPMSVWLTPGLKPFFGGTYFPPSSRWGRPGFIEILKQIAERWVESPDKLLQSADLMMDRLSRSHQAERDDSDHGAEPVAGPDTLVYGVEQFAQAYDAEHGGFGPAPKFPRPSELLFLFREHVRTGDVRSRRMAVNTLKAMAEGGLYDHVGGGFHRYSVDAKWRIPHFEKMLYDQAQLTIAYLEAAQLTGERAFVDVANETMGYVARDLTSAEGGFYSAEDADSLPANKSKSSHGVAHQSEGAFYLWTHDEIRDLLGVDAEIVRQRYGVEPNGNAPQDPTGEFRGKNQLYLARTVTEVSQRANRFEKNVLQVLDHAKQEMLVVRSHRPRPHLDDKVLTAWYGLMIGALARAAHVFEREWSPTIGRSGIEGARSLVPLEKALKAATFVRASLWDPEKKILRRRYRNGSASIDGYSEDYAFLVWGLLELFQVDGNIDWLLWARELQEKQDDLFWDEQFGGWFSTTGDDPSVLLRMKEDYDGAEPAAGSVSVLNLLKLVHLIDDGKARKKIERALQRFGSRSGHVARIMPLMAAALSQFHQGTSQIVVVGKRDQPDTQALRRCVAGHYLPFSVRVNVEPESESADIFQLLPFISSMRMLNEKATAYVCADFSCQEPVTDPDALNKQLSSLGGSLVRGKDSHSNDDL